MPQDSNSEKQTIKIKPRESTMKNLITLIILSTLASCITQQPSVKEYSVTKHYRIIGTKCSSNAYYSHELNKCVRAERVDALASQERNPGNDLPVVDTISKKQAATKRKPAKIIRTYKKLDCAYILNNINKCTI